MVRDPTDFPGPIGVRGPQRIKVDLDTVEVAGQLADGATYHYWTFNRKVPGPFVRVKVGDTVEVKLKNHDDSMVQHNVDFHAVTGPGGGAKATEAAPGETRGFEFKALNPGLYVYHCATPMVARLPLSREADAGSEPRPCQHCLRKVKEGGRSLR